MAVGVADAVAEEIVEDGAESGAFGEVVEVGPAHVLYIGGVGGDDTSDVAWLAEDEGVGVAASISTIQSAHGSSLIKVDATK